VAGYGSPQQWNMGRRTFAAATNQRHTLQRGHQSASSAAGRISRTVRSAPDRLRSGVPMADFAATCMNSLSGATPEVPVGAQR